MTRYVFKMPDLGEGTVEAEVVAWHVKVGDLVTEDQIMAEVMTDKAAVEVPAPVSGKVVSINGAPGEMVRVGSDLIVFETDSDAAGASSEPASAPASAEPTPPNAAAAPIAAETPAAETPAAAAPKGNGSAAPSKAVAVTAAGDHEGESAVASTGSGRVRASPATRRRAREAGIDLRLVEGTGPQGRITRRDFEAAREHGAGGVASARPGAAALPPRTGTEEIKIIGVRRVIANRMTEAKRNIPHFAYVEEVDVTELESLRNHLNRQAPSGTPALTYLPFLAAALVRVLEQFPQCNALHDAERNVIVRHRAVHIGIATQTPDGLKVPVVRHAEARPLAELAAEIRRVSEAARSGKASREQLTGSTITVTSLGKLGGIVSTPIINAPELAIVGVNKAVERPVVLHGAVAVRRIMNLSSSFDHRFVDGFDAAAMIQSLKEMLEHPATIFIQG
jgi:2-oxoisovalerate dehydrogenase E2 component (dihydrolipoyl transacylase)